MIFHAGRYSTSTKGQIMQAQKDRYLSSAKNHRWTNFSNFSRWMKGLPNNCEEPGLYMEDNGFVVYVTVKDSENYKLNPTCLFVEISDICNIHTPPRPYDKTAAVLERVLSIVPEFGYVHIANSLQRDSLQAESGLRKLRNREGQEFTYYMRYKQLSFVDTLSFIREPETELINGFKIRNNSMSTVYRGKK